MDETEDFSPTDQRTWSSVALLLLCSFKVLCFRSRVSALFPVCDSAGQTEATDRLVFSFEPGFRQQRSARRGML